MTISYLFWDKDTSWSWIESCQVHPHIYSGILLFYLLPKFSYIVIGVLVFYNAACFTTKQNTGEGFAFPLYIGFIKIICFSRGKDETRLTGRKEEASGKMPIKAEKAENGDRKKSLHILKGLHCFSVILVPHWTLEEFCNTHNKETVVRETWRRTIKDNNEKKKLQG